MLTKFTLLFFVLFLLQCLSFSVAAQQQENDWKKAGKEVSEAVEAISEATQETWAKTRQETSEAWEKTKQQSSEVWTDTTETSRDIADTTKKKSKTLWQKTKEKAKGAYMSLKFKIRRITSTDEKVSQT